MFVLFYASLHQPKRTLFYMSQFTGEYIFFPSRIKSNITKIRAAFDTNLNNFSLGYSIKANYDSKLIKVLNNSNVSFDCASIDELNLLLQQGIQPKNIWLNTPFLEESLIKKCIDLGVFIYADSFLNLELLQQKAHQINANIHIGLRINLPDYEFSRFGIEINEENIKKIKSIFTSNSHLKLASLHTHYSSSSDRSAENFKHKIDQFFKTLCLYFADFDLKSLNIGGGFTGEMSPALAAEFDYEIPSWDTYAGVFHQAIKKYNIKNYKIHIEPGMAMVANAYDFVAEVIDIKQTNTVSIALINTSTLFLKPTGHQRKLDFVVHETSTNKSNKEHVLVGISCMEKDILGTYAGNLEIGNKITFKNVGAYTVSYRNNFIFKQPKIIESSF